MKHKAAAAVLLLVVLLLTAAPMVSAHATLEQTVPAANAELKESPPKVELTFNEAIEQGVSSVEVLDSQSRKVTSVKAELNANRTVLQLPLPELDDGVYTVAYRIVSEDGHPVSGSYVFVLGNPPEWKDASTFLTNTSSSSSSELHAGDWLLYIVRFIYYGALLLATGVMTWSVLFRRQASESINKVFRQLTLISMRALLLSVLVLVFAQAREIMLGQPASAWGDLFLGTATGRAWAELIILSLLGFVVQKGGRYVQLLWVILLLAVESLIGHPAANDPKLLTIAFDWVHLAAAALWAGGLVVLVMIWFTDRKEAGRFGTSFSQGALLSLAALVVSGVGMTLLFLPKLSYLWLTSWGVLLVVKTALVVFVLVTGALLRIRIRRSGMPHGKLLGVDAAFMVLIVIIAAVFTYISPLPANAPYHLHEMGKDMHTTFDVTPNVPGSDNTFTLQIWLPEETGAPKSVVLRLSTDDREDAPIDVPLEIFDDQSYDTFEGFVRTSYQATGPYLPYAGKWKAEIRVMTQDDYEKLKELTFENY
ncbi:MAG: copper resistance CopC/CopD family protein [Candidatus Pristimantibacillus sp.]